MIPLKESGISQRINYCNINFVMKNYLTVEDRKSDLPTKINEK